MTLEESTDTAYNRIGMSIKLALTIYLAVESPTRLTKCKACECDAASK